MNQIKILENSRVQSAPHDRVSEELYRLHFDEAIRAALAFYMAKLRVVGAEGVVFERVITFEIQSQRLAGRDEKWSQALAL
jgi:hypothetical protein